ncbi:MAG: hypothetical protein AMXMBFR13_45260 [Phycisphaerae bacterium]
MSGCSSGLRVSGWFVALGVGLAAGRVFGFTDIGAPIPGYDKCALAWGDYDNDGDLDLAASGRANAYDTGCKVYRNDGGTFTGASTSNMVDLYNSDLAWGDYDNDGDLDLAVIGNFNDISATVRVMVNTAGTFTPGSCPYRTNGRLAWEDYNNDGLLDLVVAGFLTGEYTIKIYKNYRSSGLSDSCIDLPGVGNCGVEWADYDNDGDLDLALGGTAAGGTYFNRIYRSLSP